MSEREPTRPTDDELINRALLRLEASDWEELFTDTEARIVASQHHGGQPSEMYAFASSGAIRVEPLTDEVLREFDAAVADAQRQEDALALNALARYVHYTGERKPVENWNRDTSW